MGCSRSPCGEEKQRQEKERNSQTTSSPAYKICDRPIASDVSTTAFWRYDAGPITSEHLFIPCRSDTIIYMLNFTQIMPELFNMSHGARQQGSAAQHGSRQEQGGDRTLNAFHRRSPCVSLDRQPTRQGHQVAETQNALARLSRMCASAQ